MTNLHYFHLFYDDGIFVLNYPNPRHFCCFVIRVSIRISSGVVWTSKQVPPKGCADISITQELSAEIKEYADSVSVLFIYDFWSKDNLIQVTSSAITIIMMHWIGQQWLETCITLITFQLLIPGQAPDVKRA